MHHCQKIFVQCWGLIKATLEFDFSSDAHFFSAFEQQIQPVTIPGCDRLDKRTVREEFAKRIRLRKLPKCSLGYLCSRFHPKASARVAGGEACHWAICHPTTYIADSFGRTM